MNRLLILFLTMFTMFSANAFVFVQEFGDSLLITRTMKEVIKKENGQEFSFPTKTLKPNIIIEQELILENKTKNSFKDFTYDFAIEEGLFFVDINDNKNIERTYSSDGKNYHEKLNPTKDLYIKLKINKITPYEIRNFRIRYIHNEIIIGD